MIHGVHFELPAGISSEHLLSLRHFQQFGIMIKLFFLQICDVQVVSAAILSFPIVFLEKPIHRFPPPPVYLFCSSKLFMSSK